MKWFSAWQESLASTCELTSRANGQPSGLRGSSEDSHYVV